MRYGFYGHGKTVRTCRQSKRGSKGCYVSAADQNPRIDLGNALPYRGIDGHVTRPDMGSADKKRFADQSDGLFGGVPSHPVDMICLLTDGRNNKLDRVDTCCEHPLRYAHRKGNHTARIFLDTATIDP